MSGAKMSRFNSRRQPSYLRLTVQPHSDGKLADIPDDGTLLQDLVRRSAAKFRGVRTRER